MHENNPFTLTFGREPSTTIARLEDINKIVSSFLQ